MERIAKDFIAISVSKEHNREPYYWITFYYYRGLVIDSGCPRTAEEAAKFIEDVKLDVKAALLTHHHEDHCGGAPTFKERFGVEVFAPKSRWKYWRSLRRFQPIGGWFGVSPNH